MSTTINYIEIKPNNLDRLVKIITEQKDFDELEKNKDDFFRINRLSDLFFDREYFIYNIVFIISKEQPSDSNSLYHLFYGDFIKNIFDKLIAVINKEMIIQLTDTINELNLLEIENFHNYITSLPEDVKNNCIGNIENEIEQYYNVLVEIFSFFNKCKKNNSIIISEIS